MATRSFFYVAIGGLILVTAAGVWASRDHAADRAAANLDTPGINKVLLLPAAADNSSVISLGQAVDPSSGKSVEGYAFIFRKDSAKPDKPGGDKGNKGGPKGSSTCYAYLARGAQWKSVEPWILNPSNNEGLASDFLINNLTAGIARWEDAADGVEGDDASVDILGDGALTTELLTAETSSPDGKNEVFFGDIASDGSIGVTIVWGIFGGPPSGRELVEWDQVYDDVDFDWSSTGAAGMMDFENIATHELGHALGMGHPDDACLDETMYRFASEGETKKRDLNAGDIAGVDDLY